MSHIQLTPNELEQYEKLTNRQREIQIEQSQITQQLRQLVGDFILRALQEGQWEVTASGSHMGIRPKNKDDQDLLVRILAMSMQLGYHDGVYATTKDTGLLFRIDDSHIEVIADRRYRNQIQETTRNLNLDLLFAPLLQSLLHREIEMAISNHQVATANLKRLQDQLENMGQLFEQSDV